MICLGLGNGHEGGSGLALQEHHSLRAALLFAREPRVETILREVIADAEDRLAAFERPK